uniref:Uncharacterized protein n=1 Tax=Esox lucius TaxID=8010 RepID=A0A3P8Z3D6_ESOLU
MFAESGHNHTHELVEVVRIHMQFLGMGHTECGVGFLDVIQVLHIGQVTEAAEIPPKVQGNTSPGHGLGSNLISADTSPNACYSFALSCCPLNHICDLGVLTRTIVLL